MYDDDEECLVDDILIVPNAKLVFVADVDCVSDDNDDVAFDADVDANATVDFNDTT